LVQGWLKPGGFKLWVLTGFNLYRPTVDGGDSLSTAARRSSSSRNLPAARTTTEVGEGREDHEDEDKDEARRRYAPNADAPPAALSPAHDTEEAIMRGGGGGSLSHLAVPSGKRASVVWISVGSLAFF
jgi:hypothetical protein